MAAQVALKRKQAAEDAIALGLRMRHTSSSDEPKLGFLAPGPVFPKDESESDDSISEVNKRCRSESHSNERSSKDDSVQSDNNEFEYETEPPLKKKRTNTTKNVHLLERLFPEQKSQVLELVLQGCNGDIVRAIEHCLAVDDSRMDSNKHHRRSYHSSESSSSITMNPTPTSPAEFFKNLTAPGRPFHQGLPTFQPYMPPPSLFLPCLYPGLAGLGTSQLNTVQEAKWKSSK